MQTLLFEDDTEISWYKREILSYCACKPGMGYRQDGSLRWKRTEAYIDRVAEAFGMTRWSQLRTLQQAIELKRAVHWEHHGGSPADFPESLTPNL